MSNLTVLPGYQQFTGLNWETGPIRNALEYLGLKAPHTGMPLSEALLLGISDGLVAGYFVFEYQGIDPSVNFLTRNTFNPMETLIKRLAITTNVRQTTSWETGAANLTRALAEGAPAIVWADMASLIYNNMPSTADFCMPIPIIVYGLDGESVLISDRARVPLHATKDELQRARGRSAKDRYRLMTLTPPDLSDLPQAVEQGIRTCIRMFAEEPPLKPMRGKFGFDAFTKWADLLINEKDAKGWAKQFAPGPRMYTGLRSAYSYIQLFWTGGSGARGVYADFLDEAWVILGRPALREAAAHYRALSHQWTEFLTALLPDEVPGLGETRALMDKEYNLFVQQGAESLAERRVIKEKLDALKGSMVTNFPMEANAAKSFRQGLRERLLAIRDAEQQAISCLQAAMAF